MNYFDFYFAPVRWTVRKSEDPAAGIRTRPWEVHDPEEGLGRQGQTGYSIGYVDSVYITMCPPPPKKRCSFFLKYSLAAGMFICLYNRVLFHRRLDPWVHGRDVQQCRVREEDGDALQGRHPPLLPRPRQQNRHWCTARWLRVQVQL